MKIPESNDVKFGIRKQFWLSGEKHFADNISRGRPRKYFDLAGNLLAILFGIAEREQAEKILSSVKSVRARHLLHPVNHPRYPWWKINPLTRLFGIADYHNANSWSWLEALITVAECKAGETENALKNLATFSEIIISNGHIHETYFLDGRPFDHLFWKSAVPFAWGAGIFLWAEAKLKRKNQET